jgi:hypothetical protein
LLDSEDDYTTILPDVGLYQSTRPDIPKDCSYSNTAVFKDFNYAFPHVLTQKEANKENL